MFVQYLLLYGTLLVPIDTESLLQDLPVQAPPGGAVRRVAPRLTRQTLSAAIEGTARAAGFPARAMKKSGLPSMGAPRNGWFIIHNSIKNGGNLQMVKMMI